jgi:hypothetical protein
MSVIVISGNPVGGFEAFGPAENNEDAIEWATAQIRGEAWWTMSLNPMGERDRSHDDLAAQINWFAESEGWAIFNGNQIQRDDELAKFETDEDAIAFVQRLADLGSQLHLSALDLHFDRL